MKKILKTASLFIIAIVFTFGFSLNVFAEGECNGENGCRATSNRVIQIAGNNREYTALGSPNNTSTSKSKRYDIADIASGNYKGGIYYHSISGLKYYKNGSEMTSAIWNAYKDAYSSLWCLDGNLPGDSDTLYASRFLNDPKLGKRINTYDYAVTYVLTSGGYSTSLGKVEYWEKLMAIRAITAVFALDKKPSVSDSDIKETWSSARYALYSTVYNWLSENHSAYDRVNSLVGLSSISSFGGHTKSNYISDTGNTLKTAQNLFNEALNAAADFAENYDVGKVDTSSIPPKEDVNAKTDINNIITKQYIHTIKVSGLSNKEKDNVFTIDGVEFDDGKTYSGIVSFGITRVTIKNSQGTTDIAMNNEQFESSIKGWNILEGYDMSEDTTIEVVVTISGQKAAVYNAIGTLKCGDQPLKYHIKGTYKGPGDWAFPDYVVTIWYINKNNEQRYIGIEPAKDEGSNASREWISSNKVSLLNCSCDSLAETCKASGNINSSACRELENANCGCEYLEIACEWKPTLSECDKLSTVCDTTCETTFDTFECCDERGELIVSTIDDKEVSILGPQGKDIKACFVDKIDEQRDDNTGFTNIVGVKDQKNNSYTLGTMSENKYCSVSCKEDYVMTMPTAKLVNAGRYFTFKAKVEGTKVCYTNTIDIKQYNKDIIEKQKAMLEKYNIYKKWYELYTNGTITPVRGSYTSSCSCSYRGCGPYCSSTSYYPNWKATATVPDWQIFVKGYEETGVIDKVESTNGVSAIYTYERPIGAESYDCPGGEWTVRVCDDRDEKGKCTSYSYEDRSCSGGSRTYYTGTEVIHTEEDFRNYLYKQMVSAESALKTAKIAYENTINLFAQCTNNTWTSEMSYEPKIYYDYEENYLNEFGLIGTMNPESYSENVDSETWYCKGEDSINANYNSCKSGAKYSRNATLEDRAYMVCTAENGCVIETRTEYKKISTANFAKKTSTITASYKPATLFYNVYPSGEITVNSSDDNVALDNGLPVALNTKRGIYKYTVNIKNLGEFYDSTSKGNLGRYVGDTNRALIGDTLEYACSYLVNISKTTGWVCDFSDTCTDNCISNCIGPNCDNYCNGVDCVADCIGLGCIYDEDAGTSVVEKTVSLNNLFPNGTDSYNWNKDKNDKAKSTISEIESAGNSVYDGTPILSITIDPSTAREIKRYNDRVENDGGYSNATISCEDIGNSRELACYSSFISDLLDGDYGNNVVNENSLIADERYRDDVNRYFTKWDGRVSEDDMIGPSWKMGEVK